MALPSSGTISINDIATEFGGTVPHSLSEYYRGGGLVPDTSTNASVPTSGTIRLSNFYGAANVLWQTTLISGYLALYGGTYQEGYNSVVSIGSLFDTSVDFLSGATCTGIYFAGGANTVNFVVSGSFSNTGFTTMTVAGKAYNRTSATYNSSGGITSWSWSEPTNPFTLPVGSSYDVKFE